MVCIPDVNQIIKHMHGKTNLWAKLKFAYHRWRGTIDRLRVVIMGVKPAYQKLGLESALIMSAKKEVEKTKHYREVELSWVGDFNPKMRALHESTGATLGKTHITYRYLFTHTKAFERSTIIAVDTKNKVPRSS
jgi:GNAT superfamily N-acetyltransferase